MTDWRKAVDRELTQALRTFPHMRVGQLISNAVSEYLGQSIDLFYVTDKDLATALQSYAQEHRPKNVR